MPLRSSSVPQPENKHLQQEEKAKPPIGEFSLSDILKGVSSQPVGVQETQAPKVESVKIIQVKQQESVFSGDTGSIQEEEPSQIPEGGEDIFLGVQEDKKQVEVKEDSPFPGSEKGTSDLSQLVVQNDTSKDLVITTPKDSFFFTTFGQELSRYPINRFKAVAGAKARCAIPFVDKIAIARIHYNPSVGYYYCFSKVCCSMDGLPGIRYVLPWLVYDTDKSAKVVSSKYEIFYLQIGEDDYKDFKALHDSVPINDIDFLVTCNDEVYQKNTYQNVGPALWKNPKSPIKEEVTKKFEEVWPILPKVIARTLDETMFLKLLSQRSDRDTQHTSAPQAISNLSSFLKR